LGREIDDGPVVVSAALDRQTRRLIMIMLVSCLWA
jgi:hypothetical protein